MSERDEVQPLSEEHCRALVPHPAPDANKYSRGTLAVVGGSAAYPAAPIMAALSAARAGAGYVRLFVPGSAADVARAHLLSIPVTACATTPDGSFATEGASDLLRAAAKMRAFAIGPGMGQDVSARAFLKELLEAQSSAGDKRPALLDADALNALAVEPDLSRLRHGVLDVLTPHEGEAARLLGRKVADRLSDARELAERFEDVVVLKGPRTLIVAPDGRERVCTQAGPELAKAGTGDVLSGIIGGLLAQGVDAFDAACLGVFLHSRAGSLASDRLGVNAVMAEDIIDDIGPAYISLGG